MTNPSIAGFGLTVVDVIMRVEDIIVNHKNPVEEQVIQLGGVVPTALVTLSRLGFGTDLYTMIGHDEFAKVLTDIFTREHVAVHPADIPDGHQTPLSIVAIDKHTGERTGFNAQGVFPELEPSVFKPVLTDQTKMVLIDGHNPRCSLAFIKAAHDCSIPVLLDLGNPKLGMEELMRMANIIVVPQAYWRTIWPNTHPEKIISEFLRHGPKTVILTMGEDGALVSDGHKPIYQPAHAIRAVDTNGAGDVFMGSFVYGLASGWDLEKTVRFATGAAGFSCTQYGKEKKTPRSVAQIEEFMEKVPLKKTG